MQEQILLPNLLIIGAAKSGTTALHEYLAQHPDIFMSTPKEPRFFYVWENPQQMEIHEREGRSEHNYYHTIERYSKLFEKGKECAIRGESSTAYLANPDCAARIKKLVPHAKLIAVLRNPVERAFSNYLMYKKWQIEKKEFAAVINEEIQTGRTSYQQPMRYLFLGKYVESLKTYYGLFPAEHIRVYLYDDFETEPVNMLKDIFQFLGVDDSFVPDMKRRHNVSLINRYANAPRTNKVLSTVEKGFAKLKMPLLEKSVKSIRFYKPKFDIDDRKKLTNYYSEEISALEKILNKDLSNWRE